MTNKEIIRKVNEGFVGNDNEKIMSYVADDVRWDIVGISTHIGKDEFRKEINNENFGALPQLLPKKKLKKATG